MAGVCQPLLIGYLGFVFSVFAYAETGGSISGVVADPAGEAVAQAFVTVRDTATNVIQQVKTNAEGFYAFPSLPVGTYQLIPIRN